MEEIPDFTRGVWKTAEPFGIVDIDVRKIDRDRIHRDEKALHV